MEHKIEEELQGFSEIACQHALYPYSYGEPCRFNTYEQIQGPCGDTVRIWLYCEDELVHEAAFATDGCASSIACGSVTVSLAQGVKLQDALKIGQREVLAALGQFPVEFAHCALLASNTLKGAIKKYLNQRERNEDGRQE
ncbi:MAG: iron-sulfur cluster assembly scaffold protein [Deltaproteobacteria bacterium]|nr:iron-sulfur cluster assembly scaffold protein [Deltaproteobacteria bacterium]